MEVALLVSFSIKAIPHRESPIVRPSMLANRRCEAFLAGFRDLFGDLDDLEAVDDDSKTIEDGRSRRDEGTSLSAATADVQAAD